MKHLSEGRLRQDLLGLMSNRHPVGGSSLPALVSGAGRQIMIAPAPYRRGLHEYRHDMT